MSSIDSIFSQAIDSAVDRFTSHPHQNHLATYKDVITRQLLAQVPALQNQLAVGQYNNSTLTIAFDRAMCQPAYEGEGKTITFGFEVCNTRTGATQSLSAKAVETHPVGVQIAARHIHAQALAPAPAHAPVQGYYYSQASGSASYLAPSASASAQLEQLQVQVQMIAQQRAESQSESTQMVRNQLHADISAWVRSRADLPLTAQLTWKSDNAAEVARTAGLDSTDRQTGARNFVRCSFAVRPNASSIDWNGYTATAQGEVVGNAFDQFGTQHGVPSARFHSVYQLCYDRD